MTSHPILLILNPFSKGLILMKKTYILLIASLASICINTSSSHWNNRRLNNSRPALANHSEFIFMSRGQVQNSPDKAKKFAARCLLEITTYFTKITGCSAWQENFRCSSYDKEMTHQDLEHTPGFDEPLTCGNMQSPCCEKLRDCSKQQLDDLLKNALYFATDSIYPQLRCYIASLICLGANPNTKPHNDNPALHKAVQHSDYHFVRFLLASGANPNLLDESDPILPLKCKNVRIAQELIEHGASINAQDPLLGMSALHWAISDEDVDKNGEQSKLYIERGAKVNSRDSSGYTALMDLALDCDDQDAELALKKAGLLRTAGAKTHHRVTDGFYEGKTAYEIAHSEPGSASCEALATFLNDWEAEKNRMPDC